MVPFITSVLSLTLAMTTITTGTRESYSPLFPLESRKHARSPYTVCAGLIVYRILQINNGVASQDITRVGGNRKLTRVVRILVESGLLYTASVIVFFATFLASNNAQYGVSDVVSARHASPSHSQIRERKY